MHILSGMQRLVDLWCIAKPQPPATRITILLRQSQPLFVHVRCRRWIDCKVWFMSLPTRDRLSGELVNVWSFESFIAKKSNSHSCQCFLRRPIRVARFHWTEQVSIFRYLAQFGAQRRGRKSRNHNSPWRALAVSSILVAIAFLPL